MIVMNSLSMSSVDVIAVVIDMSCHCRCVGSHEQFVEDTPGHESRNGESSRPRQCSGRLPHFIQVHQGVQVPGHSESVVEVGRVDAGILDDVQVDSPKEDENGDVFQIVLVRPPHPLYVRVGTSDFGVGVSLPSSELIKV